MADESGKDLAGAMPDDVMKRFRKEVMEANTLLEWVVAVGKEIKPADLVERVKRGQEYLRANEIGTKEKAEFESAYNELTKLTSPVTWETLQATDDQSGVKTILAPFRYMKGQPVSAGRRWCKVLWLLTFFLLLLILVGESLQEYLDIFSPVDSEVVETGRSIEWGRITFWFSKVVPFLYGALGACAYLIRAGNKHIYERSFDPRRLPEYLNRILLGFLAGGFVHLFISPGAITPEIAGVQTWTQELGARGLAFLAGYSTDFLYTTLERVTGALLPKKVAGSEAATTEKRPEA